MQISCGIKALGKMQVIGLYQGNMLEYEKKITISSVSPMKAFTHTFTKRPINASITIYKGTVEKACYILMEV